ncbi:MAG TPA: ThuA domain-containing protein [Panacibacter sp.]|nr:ThuA domain-containing protein [Panacibacter sp.]HNP45061.1 ThuA domain-containing protein [Panacibacter sp.]
MKRINLRLVILLISIALSPVAFAQQNPLFKVVAFYTAKSDLAHISFVHEANRWFPKAAAENNFTYDSTNDWSNLNEAFLKNYNVVLFLDTRPEAPEQRKAFENYMKKGGGWMGFHFAGFALTPSDFNQDWDWYHNEFIGAGQYKSNTWRPTPAMLRVEEAGNPATKRLPPVFRSSPNEWYSWEKDLTKNPDIKILLSIDSTSFPLGTGPKLHEIWHSGYYPVAWTNTKYKMIYDNMGHNDIDYEHGSNKELSFQFDNEIQNRFIVDALFWLAGIKK